MPPQTTAHLERPPALGKEPPAYVRLRARTIVLIGLMGVGKTTIGRGLATALGMSFRDADAEIERAAGCSVADIFSEHGEAAFREGERRVIARLLTQEPPHVLAFGGGAFVDPDTRALALERTLSVWLKADIEVLARRVARRKTRPLLQGRAPEAVLAAQAEARTPAYAQAHLSVDTGDSYQAAAINAVLAALCGHVSSDGDMGARPAEPPRPS